MKRWWEAQAARIDSLSLRERVFLFLSVVASCVALVDGVWLSPAQAAHKQLTQRFDKQSVELQRARDDLQATAKPADTHQAVRDEIAAVQISLDTANQTIKNISSVATEATPLAQVLTHLLRRHEGLTLLRTSTVLPEAAIGKAASAVGAGAIALPGGLTRQGVELSVSGPYPELMRFVQTLENALPQVRWGSMKLKSEKSSPELTLQLFLVGA
jgi:MSHA biogenesis protein MshJ